MRKDTVAERNITIPVYPAILMSTLILFSSCSLTKSGYAPSKKYSPSQLQKDYGIFRGVLEESHPGLYWYTPRDSMDMYFDEGFSKLKDSMNEASFRRILSYVTARMNCGHTVTRPSKNYSRYRDSTRTKLFPLAMKIWDESAVVALNLHRRDSLLTRGAVIRSINHLTVQEIADSLFRFISSDGYGLTHKYQTLSNGLNFGSMFNAVFGSRDRYTVEFIDTLGMERAGTLPAYDPARDSITQAGVRRPRYSRSERKRRATESARSLRIDTARSTAFLDLNSFSKGYVLKPFFRKSFKALRENGIRFLVIDLRANGGGNVTNSTALTRYIADKRFRLADSLYAINRNSRYKKYIKNYFFNQLFMLLTTRKRQGRYHFGYFERHDFKPKKKSRFEGTVFILTGGNSFSASTLFTLCVMDQENVIVLGEETGGAAYGNNAWLIPDVVLPETGISMRLPLFRLVMDKDRPKDGRGIRPEIEVGPSVEAIKKGRDYKMDKVLEIIETLSKRDGG